MMMLLARYTLTTWLHGARYRHSPSVHVVSCTNTCCFLFCDSGSFPGTLLVCSSPLDVVGAQHACFVRTRSLLFFRLLLDLRRFGKPEILTTSAEVKGRGDARNMASKAMLYKLFPIVSTDETSR